MSFRFNPRTAPRRAFFAHHGEVEECPHHGGTVFTYGYYDDDYYAYPRYTYGYGYPYGYRRAYYGYRGYYPTYRRAYVYGGYPSYRRAYYGALDPLILPHLDHRSVQIGPVPALEPPGSRLNSAATGQLLPHATGAIYIGPRQPAAWAI